MTAPQPLSGLSAADVETRRNRITGTTAAKILGVSPYGTPLDAFLEIVGWRQPEPNAAMEWGLRLQEPVARRFADDNGVDLVPCETREHPTLPCLAASGDYWIGTGDGELLEVKTTTERNAKHWGRPGTDQIPFGYFVQCVIQMAVYDAPRVHVAVLFLDSRRYETYVVERDPETERVILGVLSAWHAKHVATGTPPEPTTPAETIRETERLFPRSTGRLIPSVPEAEEAVERLRIAQRMLDAAKADHEAAKAVLCALIGDADGIEGDGWRVTWKAARASSVTDWRQVALDAGADAETIARNTTQRPGSRRFLTRFDASEGDE